MGLDSIGMGINPLLPLVDTFTLVLTPTEGKRVCSELLQSWKHDTQTNSLRIRYFPEY